MSGKTSGSARLRLTSGLAGATLLLLAGCASSGSSSSPGPPSSPSSSSSPSASGPSSSPSPSSTPPNGSTSSRPSATPSATPPLGSPINQPLWPFTTLSQAQAWEQSYVSGGHQPWHLDAGQTALAFAQGYLGFTDITKVTSTNVAGRDAHIGVGYPTPSTPPGTATAAVLHLVRYGPDPTAPWEVVGSADSTLTLTTPAYGARATSPLTAGGTVTGVDEDVRVQIRQPSSTSPLGQSGHNPAGGTNTPWSAKVSYTGATDPVLTVVAYTGGHLLAVERFAITAVRTG
jgi:hypothetical protein